MMVLESCCYVSSIELSQHKENIGIYGRINEIKLINYHSLSCTIPALHNAITKHD